MSANYRGDFFDSHCMSVRRLAEVSCIQFLLCRICVDEIYFIITYLCRNLICNILLWQFWGSVKVTLLYIEVCSLKLIYTVFRKKHPLTFSFISPWVLCRFKQKLQWIYTRNGRFWQCRN